MSARLIAMSTLMSKKRKEKHEDMIHNEHELYGMIEY